MSLRGKTPEELAAMSDEDIDFSDIPEADGDFWKNARWVTPEERRAELRLNKEIHHWFKHHSEEYPSIGAILKSYVAEQELQEDRPHA